MDDDQLCDKMTELAETFPCLRGAPGVSPWAPAELGRWAAGPASHGERATANFVLAVWDGSAGSEAGGFDLMEALRVWPPDHRGPFLKWASDPWWP